MKEKFTERWKAFVADIADKYKIPPIQLQENAIELLEKYEWPGNIRQLKNVAEQMSAVEKNRIISTEILKNYLPEKQNNTPVLFKHEQKENDFSER